MTQLERPDFGHDLFGSPIDLDGTSRSRRPDCFETIAAMIAVEEFTSRIFQNPVRMQATSDPEIMGFGYLVVNVRAHGDHAEVREKCRDWYTELARIAPDVRRLFRLSIDAT